MVKSISTEQKILDAARKIFIAKGLFGARMQEIADEAGINKALLHYYFRNKEKLFERIFTDAFKTVFLGVDLALSSEAPLFEKLRRLVDAYIEVFIQNPYLPVFVLNEINQNPERLQKIVGKDIERVVSEFFVQIMSEINKGTIRPINPIHLILNIIGMLVIPFAARGMIAPVLESKVGVNYDQVLAERKEVIYQFVYNALKVDKDE